MADETTHLQMAVADAGVELFIGLDRKLHARPKEKLTPELRDRIKARKDHLLGELFVAETLAWEYENYSAADRDRMRANCPADLRARWKTCFDVAIVCYLAGDAGGAAASMAQYREVTKAVARVVDAPVVDWPVEPREYPERTR